MSMQFSDLAAMAAADGVISPDELRSLRMSAWMDGVIGQNEAAALFAINDQVENPGAEWVDFFVEALSCWLVDRQNPRGYVDEAQAQWLIERIAADGHVSAPAELELLVRCFEKALSTPRALKDFALQEIEKFVMSPETGGLTAARGKLLRRLIFSPGSERPAAVCLAEAEMLFAIKDAMLGRDNAPEWQQLFVQGVGNYLQGFGGAEPLSRDREAALEQFMATPDKGLGGFLAQMGRSDVRGGICDLMRMRQPERDLDTEIFEARQITSGESGWLRQEIDRDGGTDAYEQALLAFIAEE